NGDLQLVMGNSGYVPNSLAPFVNGYEFECMDAQWNPSVIEQIGQLSQAGWRSVFDAYRTVQATTRRPRINLILGCGPAYTLSGPGYSIPTSGDLRNHRLTLGTTLLDDGFYGFSLHDAFSAPLWMDEYSVDSAGIAVEDRKKKGYLGRALTDAVELTTPG